jgi:glycosyltransferase involved in cell wall biosynthesis
LKILVFIYSLSSGGAERVTSSLINEWISKGHCVSLVTQKDQSSDFYEVNPKINRVVLDLAKESTGLSSALINNFKRLCRLRAIIKTDKPDIILSMMTSSNIISIVANYALKIPIIVSERTYPPLLPVSRPWQILRKLTYPFASRVVMLTTEGLNWLQREIPKANGLVIPNPVLYPLPINRPILDPHSVIKADRNILLAVGRMSEEKGFAGLINTFATLSKIHTKWDLVILGDGPMRVELQQQIEKASLGNRVFMPGRAGNVSEWYEQANLFVLSSRVEGFPNTLSEAMTHACPVISFDCLTGPRDLIKNGENGVLVAAGDYQELEKSLGELMENDVYRKRMAVNAICVREKFGLDKVMKEWMLLIEAHVSK